MPQPDLQQKLTSSFKDLVTAIADQNLAEIDILVTVGGKRPEFDDLMLRLKKMQGILTEKAVELIKLYRANGGENEQQVTDECKSIIEETIQRFVKQI
ncbi:MAG: hypothetical protein R2800_14945 [Flavipsychrobacter sp.]